MNNISISELNKKLSHINVIDVRNAFIESTIYSFKDNQIETETIELALLMTLIFALAKCMQETGAIKKLIDGLKSLVKKNGILGVIPAIYGLMPVPGGALFSAPMIDEEGDKYKLDKNQKNFLNIWFRHIWFPIYPISFAMILICSAEFSNIDISNIVLANSPAFFAFIIIGYLFIMKFSKNVAVKVDEKNNSYNGLIYLIPPIFPIVIYVILWFFDFPKVRSFLIGIIISIFLLFFILKENNKNFLSIFKKSIT